MLYQRKRRGTHLAVVLAVVVALLAGVGVGVWWGTRENTPQEQPQASQEQPVTPTPTPTPTPTTVPGGGVWADPSTVNTRDVDAVAKAVAEASAQHDTTTDRTQTAALRRAAPLMTEQLLARQVEPERLNPTDDWLEAERANGYSVAVAHPLEVHFKPHGKQIESYAFTVEITWYGRTPATEVARGVRTVYLDATQVDGGWKVSEFWAETPPHLDRG